MTTYLPEIVQMLQQKLKAKEPDDSPWVEISYLHQGFSSSKPRWEVVLFGRKHQRFTAPTLEQALSKAEEWLVTNQAADANEAIGLNRDGTFKTTSDHAPVAATENAKIE